MHQTHRPVCPQVGADHLSMTRLCVKDHSHPSAVVTVLKPGHPVDPWSLCAAIQFWEISTHTHTPPPPSVPHCHLFPSSLPLNRPPSPFVLLTSTPFLTHQPPSSPCSYPSGLPSRSIPQAVHTEAYCECREKAAYSQSNQRKVMCAAEMHPVFLMCINILQQQNLLLYLVILLQHAFADGRGGWTVNDYCFPAVPLSWG